MHSHERTSSKRRLRLLSVELTGGESCSFDCEQTFSLTSETTCSFGTLTQIGTCVRNCSAIDDTITNVPFRFISSNEQKAFAYQDSITVLNSETSIPVKVSIPTSSLESDDISISTTPNRAYSVRTILHRDVAFSSDRTIKISHQAFDHLGRSSVDRNDLTIEMVLTHSLSSEVVKTCNIVGSECSESVPESWFSSSNSTVMAVIRYTYDDGAIHQTQMRSHSFLIPMHNTLSNAGVWVELQHIPCMQARQLRSPCMRIRIRIRLSTFNIVLNYDQSALSYVETNEASPYLVTTGTSTENEINMLGAPRWTQKTV